MNTVNIIPKEVTDVSPWCRSKAFTLVELLVVVAMTVIILGMAGGLLSTLFSNYSVGSRIGTVTKLSQKGVFHKSWEGELLMGGFGKDETGRTVANIWRFSITDDKIAAKVQDVMDHNKPVKLEYNQGGLRLWSRDTSYVITGVKLIE